VSGENAQKVRSAIEAWNRHDLDDFLSIFHPDCEALFRPEVRSPAHIMASTGYVAGPRAFFRHFPITEPRSSS
jgi:hypothetical protein